MKFTIVTIHIGTMKLKKSILYIFFLLKFPIFFSFSCNGHSPFYSTETNIPLGEGGWGSGEFLEGIKKCWKCSKHGGGGLKRILRRFLVFYGTIRWLRMEPIFLHSIKIYFYLSPPFLEGMNIFVWMATIKFKIKEKKIICFAIIYKYVNR